MILITLRILLAVALGYLLPGYFAARLLQVRASLWLSFGLSLLCLFQVVFWLGVVGVPLTFWSVGGVLLLVNAALGWRCWRHNRWRPRRPTLPAGWLARLCLALSAALLLLAAWSYLRAPLAGYDTYFRWDYLGRKLHELGHFAFYPPLSAADYRHYFYTDGIPPLVSFSYFWLYAAAGQPHHLLSGISVLLQLVSLCLIAAALARRLGDERAAALAPLLLLATPIITWSVLIGQENGLVTLALGATLVLLWDARESDDIGYPILAGACAALGMLAREYGGIVLICGGICALWWRHKPWQLYLFGLSTCVLGAPWYLRNWLRTGNPLYSLEVLGFPVNPVHAEVMAEAGKQFGMTRNLPAWLADAGAFLLPQAGLVLIAGLIAVAWHLRRRGWLAVCVVLLVAVWLHSVGYTVGLAYTTRVLTMALLLLAAAAAALLTRARRRWLQLSLGVVIAATLLLGATYIAIFPGRQMPPNLAILSRVVRFHYLPLPADEVALREDLRQFAGRNLRILTDNAYAHVVLADIDVEAVPTWSPEVRFIADPRLSGAEVREKLKQRGIRCILYYPHSTGGAYLRQLPLMREDRHNWTLLKDHGPWIFYALP